MKKLLMFMKDSAAVERYNSEVEKRETGVAWEENMSKSCRMMIAAITLCLLLMVGTGAKPRDVKTGKLVQDQSWLKTLRNVFVIGIPPGRVVAAAAELNPPATPAPAVQPDPTPLPALEPPKVKGIYLTAWMTGDSRFMERIAQFIEQTEINSVVIDVKDDTGTISYPSQAPLAKTVGSGEKKFDPHQVLKFLKARNIYPIARIVVFKDPFLAKRRTDLAVKSAQGGLWHDFKGLCWVDPYNKTVWEYTVAIAKEAALYGFKEIQFDYVRFTSDGILRDCRYPGNDGRLKSDVIRDFLQYAYQQLNPLGIKVSADVFGLACSAQDDLGIGQVLEKVATGVDIVCPMVYPSHYRRGEYNLPDPDRAPYRTVYQSMMDAKRKLSKLNPERKVIMRPWLQDFSLRNRYGRAELLAQIKAVEDAGYEEYIFWNPANKYDLGKYRSGPAKNPQIRSVPVATPSIPVVPTTPAPSPDSLPEVKP